MPKRENQDAVKEHGIDLQAIFGELLDRSEMTRYRIAQETGLSETVLSNYVTGKRRPSLEALVAIAELSGSRVVVRIDDGKR